MRLLEDLVEAFPSGITAAFAYGSGAVRQAGADSDPAKKMLDFIFVVEDPPNWHAANIKRHPSHYSFLRIFGPHAVAGVQRGFGPAGVYYNTLVPFSCRNSSKPTLIKYGVVSEADFKRDLLEWSALYVSGRLHKPIAWVRPPPGDHEAAIERNLRSALACGLLLLPRRFAAKDLFTAITGISYTGDFRMWIGEDREKVGKIVSAQLDRFCELYQTSLEDFSWAVAPLGDGQFERGLEPGVQLRLLAGLAPGLRRNLPLTSPQPATGEKAAMEALSREDWDVCARGCRAALSHIVFWPSLLQACKGVLTAGAAKSVRYSAAKLLKMTASLIKR